jgi:hypothetical protein
MAYDTAVFVIMWFNFITNMITSIAEITCIIFAKDPIEYILAFDFGLFILHVPIGISTLFVIYTRKDITQKKIAKGRLMINVPAYITIFLVSLNMWINFIIPTICLFSALILVEIIVAIVIIFGDKEDMSISMKGDNGASS